MNIIERTRPKGFNRKVWQHFYAKAEQDKAWALDIVKNKPEWSRETSSASLEMLGERLHKKPWDLARSAYLYLEMRAYGITSCGALDPSARRKWEALTCRKIRSGTWRYDHRTHTTGAKKVGREWVDFRGNKIQGGAA